MSVPKKMPGLRKVPVFFSFVLFLSLAGGCGFQLRGSGVESSLQTVHLSSVKGVKLMGPLRQRLTALGITLVNKPEQAELSLRLLADNFERRTSSVTGRALAAEYELTMTVQFQITNPDSEIVLTDQQLEVSRIFAIDQGNLVGSSEEQALLVTEMREDLVQQIIRSMNTVVR